MLEVRITPQNLRRPPRRNGLIWKRFIRNSNASSTQHKSSYLLHLFKRLGRFGAGPSCLLPLNHHLMYPTFCVSNCPLTLRKRASFHHKKGGVWKIISSLLARDVGIWFLRVWKPNFIGQLWKPESCLTPFVNYIPNNQTNERTNIEKNDLNHRQSHFNVNDSTLKLPWKQREIVKRGFNHFTNNIIEANSKRGCESFKPWGLKQSLWENRWEGTNHTSPLWNGAQSRSCLSFTF